MLTYLKRKIQNAMDALESLLLLLLMPIFGACLPWLIICWLLLLSPPRRKDETKNKSSHLEASDDGT
jgi:urea transporter